MVGIQVISAKIGRLSGHGLPPTSAATIRAGCCTVSSACCWWPIPSILRLMPPPWRSLKLLAGGPAHPYALGFGRCRCCRRFHSYIVMYAKWLTLALLAYVVTAFAVHTPWADAAARTVCPSCPKPAYITNDRRGIRRPSALTCSSGRHRRRSKNEAQPKARPLRDAPDQASAIPQDHA